MPLYTYTVLSNFEATTAPTVNDDETLGYAEGSLWVDVAAGDAYILVECEEAAAVWKKITP